MFLVDTDVLSALRKRERHPDIVRWVSKQRSTDLYLSVVSVGEIERGIARQERRDPVYALIRDGVTVTYRNEENELVKERLRVLDFERPANNHFLCVR